MGKVPRATCAYLSQGTSYGMALSPWTHRESAYDIFGLERASFLRTYGHPDVVLFYCDMSELAGVDVGRTC